MFHCRVWLMVKSQKWIHSLIYRSVRFYSRKTEDCLERLVEESNRMIFMTILVFTLSISLAKNVQDFILYLIVLYGWKQSLHHFWVHSARVSKSIHLIFCGNFLDRQMKEKTTYLWDSPAISISLTSFQWIDGFCEFVGQRLLHVFFVEFFALSKVCYLFWTQIGLQILNVINARGIAQLLLEFLVLKFTLKNAFIHIKIRAVLGLLEPQDYFG